MKRPFVFIGHNNFVTDLADIVHALDGFVLEIVEKLCTDVGIIARGKLVHQGSMAELRRDGSLEDRFLAVVGSGGHERQTLSWLDRE